MLDRAAELFDPPSTVGNVPCVRFLRTDVSDVKPYEGPFDAVVLTIRSLRNTTRRMRFVARRCCSNRDPRS